jgi:hypothetical protein
MISLLKEDWIKDDKLKKWSSVSSTQGSNKCKCNDDSFFVELWEHDSCIRGRIDTVVCTKCDDIINFRIIR